MEFWIFVSLAISFVCFLVSLFKANPKLTGGEIILLAFVSIFWPVLIWLIYGAMKRDIRRKRALRNRL